MLRNFILIFLLCLSQHLSAQYSVQGKVLDSKSKNPLAFVTLLVEGQRSGSYTDIDGKFVLLSSSPIEKIRLSYVGYETVILEIDNDDELEIFLEATPFQLKEAVVIDKENPAHRIIREVINRKDEHDPEKGSSFSYESYNKLIFTADIDSALLNHPERINELDSSDQDALNFFNKQHLFMMESVTERKFMPPDRNNEVVKATRVSGLKHPDFAVLGTQLQSFSFYKEEIAVLDEKYLSPVAKGAINKYVYTLEDTTYQERDTVFIISYQPASKKNFKGLKGTLYINSKGYAIQNVIAEPFEKTEDGLDIRIQQQYEWIDEKKWFPTQLNSTLYFNMISLDNYRMIGIGRSYLKNIVIDAAVTRKDFNHVTLKLEKMATKQPDSYWNQFRIDSLDQKELRTYEYIDSIGDAENLDLKLKTLQTLITGRIPIGAFNLDVSKMLAFNRYEGLRLGLGIETGDKISEKLRLGVYGAYGFKDKELKYGSSLRYSIEKKREVYAELKAEHDVVEFGGQDFSERIGLFDPSGYFRLYVNRMEIYDAGEFGLGFRALGFSTWRFSARRERRQAFDGYLFSTPANEFVTIQDELYDLFTLRADLRIALGEKFIETMTRQVSLGSKYPVLNLQFRKGFDDLLDGAFDFYRMDALLSHSIDLKNVGTFSFKVRGAYISEALPASMLINPRSTNNGLFGVFSPYAFEAMRINEFLANRFVGVHLRHNFRRLLLRGKHFAPEFVLVHNAGIGDLSSADRHENVEFKIPNKAYLESGLQIDNLFLSGFSGFGIGAFYRYGPWGNPEFKDNIAIKLTLKTSF